MIRKVVIAACTIVLAASPVEAKHWWDFHWRDPDPKYGQPGHEFHWLNEPIPEWAGLKLDTYMRALPSASVSRIKHNGTVTYYDSERDRYMICRIGGKDETTPVNCHEEFSTYPPTPWGDPRKLSAPDPDFLLHSLKGRGGEEETP